MSLIDKQREIGSQIEKLVINFKKDSKERKTPDYLAERIRRLETLAEEFHRNHNEILAQEIKDDDDEYYVKTKELVIRYIKIMENQSLEYIDVEDAGGSGVDSRVGAGAIPKSKKPQSNTAEANEIPALSTEAQKILRNQRALIKALNRNLEEIAAQRQIEHPTTYFEVKAAVLEKHMTDFTKNNEWLWDSTTADHILEYTPQLFYEMESKVESAIIELRQHMHTEERTIRNQQVSHHYENDGPLPKISVPTFNGNYSQWMAFKALYIELVHNANISDIRKMHYLTQALTGEPKILIQHLPAIGENYVSAWTILTSRYDNKRLLVTTLLNKLLTQPATKADSSASLKALHDVTKECLHGLEAQGIPVSYWDTMIAHIVIKKMDSATQTSFEQGLDDNKRLLTREEVLKFLERRFQSLEARGRVDSSSKTCATAIETDSRCKVCKKDSHPLYACGKFTSANSKEKWQWINQLRLCANCLKSGHRANSCNRQHCLKCTKKHNTLLHVERSAQTIRRPMQQGTQESSNGTMTTQQNNIVTKPSNATINDTTKVSLVTNNNDSKGTHVLLGTALIELIAENGEPIECRALLDSCSQVNLITERLMKKLGKTPSIMPTCVEGIGVIGNTIRHRTTIHLQSRCSKFSAILDAHVIPKIVSNQPSHQLLIHNWNIPNKITLADPTFARPGRIDCLLGAEVYLDLLTQGKIKLSENLPTLQNTVFGWIIAGSVNGTQTNKVTCGVCTTQELEESISRFWQLEDTPHSSSSLTEDELRCESHFVQHITRSKDGKYVVKLPLKEHPSVLGNSKPMAYSRFLAMERRLQQNSELKAQYTQFMTEYEKLGHMTEINIDEGVSTPYFIPHHCILRPESTSTKLRVVFDASAKTTKGISLNEIMYTGPTVQSELFSLLLRFRIHKYVLKTDVEKMYRQIWVNEDDRKLQIIMWRNSPTERLKYYQLNTVTYGTRSAPYLATRCLRQLADDYQDHFPSGAASLKTDFYVDDGLIGADTMREALEIQEQLITILGKAGMKLRKWCANNPRLLHGIPSGDQEIDLNFDSNNTQSIKTLGLLWLPKSDVFCIKANVQERTTTTKRSMTSDLARIFDPLGIVGPVVVTAKIFIQQLWQLKIDWDDDLPTEIQRQWTRFQDDLPSLDNATVRRHVLSDQGQINIQLHAFADASEKAYGAAIYVRSVLKDKSIKLNLLCSKSRVAPLNQQTIPRLELCAALLAAELMSRVKCDLNYQNKAAYFWTDSQIVLSWINNHPGTLPVFVAHRIIKINQLTNTEQWRHVSSKHNPADILSRGLKPKELTTCHMWFYGPLFLYHRESMWPPPFNRELIIEDIPSTVAIASKKEISEPDKDFVYSIPSKNSFNYIQRVVGYMLRFVKNLKSQSKNSRPESIHLSPPELDKALKFMVRQIQTTDFQDLRKILLKEGRVPNSNALNSLTPFLDEEGIIRVGGRLSSSSQQYDAKHQMILPGDDPLTKLLVKKLHMENYHCGPSALLYLVKQRFWPLKGRSLVRSVIQHCVRCTRSKPILYKQIMGNLPALRVEPARPFIHAGVDYCGPFRVHFKTRGKPPQKAYIAVFCCFATKAVHLELVTELTTDAFIGALKRFIARRGHCKTIFCDNATNFVGAKNQLEELKDKIYSPTASEAIIRNCSEKGINFQFIPPRSPHFGGLWEAAVKSTKTLLAPKLYEASMTFEELNTVITEIEAMLNSRPLIPMSSDPNDLNALTPGHFLIGEPLVSNVDIYAKPSTAKMSARWEEVSKLKHHFWQRWSTEYLSELQQRCKWKGPATIIKPGTMVIIKEDNCPVLRWPLGRIIKVYKGNDGAVRVCDIKTQKGVMERPIHNLAPLFPEEETSSDVQVDSNSQAITNTDDDGIQVDNEALTEKTEPSQASLLIKIPLNRLKPSRSWDNNGTPSKVRRIQPGILLTLITLFLLPLVLCNPINITEFNTRPGIYFEPSGTVKLITTNWNIVVYYDLAPYRDQLDTLIDGTITLQKLCDHSPNDTTCTFLLEYFDSIKRHLETELNLLSVKRTRRGAVDLVGNIANSLFGVLDSNYATKMSATINELQKHDEHLERLLKNQTSLIDSTINIFKEKQLNIKAKFDEIDEHLEDLINGRASSESNNKILILTLAVQMFIMASRLQETHASIMDVLIDSHHGKINPRLLTPDQLGNEIQKIKAHLPPNLHLPIHQGNVLEVYQLMKVSGIVAENHVVFSIDLPLADSKEFKLLHLVPIPTAVNGTLLSVKLSTPFLAVSPHHDEFVPLSSDELNSCSTLSYNEWVCSNIQATHQKPSSVSQCELDVLNNETNPRCELSLLNKTISWYQLKQANQWIYATNLSIRLTVVCGDDNRQITLHNSGLLQFRADCTIKNNLITILGHQRVVTSLQVKDTKIGMPPGWATQYTLNPMKIKAFKDNVQDLELVQQGLANINASSFSYEQATDAHSLIISYVAVILTVLVIAFMITLLCKFNHFRRSNHALPVPAPRSLRHIEDTAC